MTDALAALHANYRRLARYNAWMNERLYDAAEGLPEAERRRDRGAFFGSIDGTLNHLLWADRLWLRRFASQGVAFPALADDLLALPEGASYGTVLQAEWQGLRQARRALDAAIVRWVDEMPPEFLLRTLRYANTKGVVREQPAWQPLTHFFNHQTHHRGQVTTLLLQAGVDPGVTDLVAMSEA
ncbi:MULTISPECIES: DinB family protein [Ramlibacter]|uniref:Damage-inducible protein DinB n=1 Tax=Ramlibacter pinisoli TaxID=2682844 RepID=A0A6N8IQ62_9BURK|nr:MULTISPECIES: DinB family protein [Ramlibacter]MBA2963978.1 DinB family protein [Ramlibacter sp. CGMCC 1.13660]MVQ28944.1 damage-inducible protein DinB [Ramlibacter pinisoli]